MYTKCGHCGEILEDPGKEFSCPKCGTKIQSRVDFFEDVEVVEETSPAQQLGSPTGYSIFKAIASAGCLLAILSYTLILSLCILIYFYAIPAVAAHWAEAKAIPFVLLPFPAGLVVLEGYGFAAYWVFIVVLFGASLAWFVWPERELLKKTFMDCLPKVRAPSRSNNSTFVIVAQMFLAILFFDSIYYFLVQTGGASPNTPSFPTQLWGNLYDFLNASVWEEIAARILLIGVPLLLILLVKSLADGTFGPKTSDTSKAIRRALRLLAGGHNEFTPITVGLIVFSSLMFGFAHAPGWDYWKVIPTAVSGLGFGYIYVKKGVHGAILLHFSFDYLGVAEGLLPNTAAMLGALTIILFLWMFVGLIYFVYYGAKMGRFFAEPDEGWARPRHGTGTSMLWDLLGWS